MKLFLIAFNLIIGIGETAIFFESHNIMTGVIALANIGIALFVLFSPDKI
jgi:hypothetical protein